MITINTGAEYYGSDAKQDDIDRRVAAIVRAFERAGWTVELSDHLRGTSAEYYEARRSEADDAHDSDEGAWFDAWCGGGAWAVYSWARANR